MFNVQCSMFQADNVKMGDVMAVHIALGRWTEGEIDRFLATASRLEDVGERIQYISGKFLEVPYQESTLIGNTAINEEFVVNFSGIDCFTFLDYVEALRQSFSFRQFLDRLKKIRYRSGNVSYIMRNHFFTDWREFNGGSIKDITREIGGEKTRSALKSLNMKSDGSLFLDGIAVESRSIDYIPTASIDEVVLNAMNTGDYIGIYTETDGLDVSHVGIAITHDDGLYLRHASSAASCRKVTDRLLVNYIKEKPGIVVLRPQSLHFEIFRGTI